MEYTQASTQGQHTGRRRLCAGLTTTIACRLKDAFVDHQDTMHVFAWWVLALLTVFEVLAPRGLTSHQNQPWLLFRTAKHTLNTLMIHLHRSSIKASRQAKATAAKQIFFSGAARSSTPPGLVFSPLSWFTRHLTPPATHHPTTPATATAHHQPSITMQQQQQAAHQDQPPAGALGAKWQDMPTELVAAFLQHVPCQDRLTQAAMVSKQWHKAAHRATQDICAAIATSQLPDITAWLAKHGRSLQSLDIESSRDEEEDRIHGCLHLPLAHLPQLTSLTLSLRPTHILHLPAPPWLTLRDTPTATPALMMPKVEALRLHDFFLDSLTTLMQLSHLSALTELQLLHIHTPPSSTKQLSTAIATLLKSLPLAVVALDSVDLDESAWTHLSSATSLLRLYVENIPSAQAVRHVFNALPAGITKLCVDDRQVGQSRFPAITSSLTCGSALQELRLVEIGLRPHSLDGLTQLRVLHLENCKVLSGLHEAQADVDDGAALLAAVAEMKQVETLLIESDDVVLFSVEPQHLAALTASTNLKTLHVCSWDSLLPPDALKFMFAGNRLLPELQHLGLSCQLDVLYAELDSASTPPADLGLVCASCRGLTSLLLHNVLGPGILSANLPPLCASLSIGGEAIDDAAAAVLCNNTQLRHLGIWGAPALTNAGLEHVTRLANLEFVGIFGWDGRTPEVVPPGQGYLYKGEEGYNFLQLAVSDESPKPVCEQLRDVLDGHVVVPPWQPAEEEGIWSYENLEQRVVGLQPDVPCVKSGFFEKPV